MSMNCYAVRKRPGFPDMVGFVKEEKLVKDSFLFQRKREGNRGYKNEKRECKTKNKYSTTDNKDPQDTFYLLRSLFHTQNPTVLAYLSVCCAVVKW